MTLEEVHALISDRIGKDNFKTETFRDNHRIIVTLDNFLDVMECLKEDGGFDYLCEHSASDYLNYPDARDRYGLWYVLVNTSVGLQVIVKTWVNDPEPSVPSVYDLWNGADWMERETYDMFGITFEGHPDLRRVLLPDEFTSFPLRKDYPMRGRSERHNFPVITRSES